MAKLRTKPSASSKQQESFGLLLKKLSNDYPQLVFEAAQDFSWSPENDRIQYGPVSKTAVWSLLHEVGHVMSEHKNYSTDFSLLLLEVEAWQKGPNRWLLC